MQRGAYDWRRDASDLMIDVGLALVLVALVVVLGVVTLGSPR
jgi:hypothetical protein